MDKAINRIFFVLVCVLTFAFAFVTFSGRGALGSEGLYGYGRMLVLTEFVMLSFIAVNLRLLHRPPPLVKAICLWLLWPSITCLHLFVYGPSAAVFGIMQVLYCPLFFLFFYILIKMDPKMFRATVAFFALLLCVVSLLYLLVFRYQNFESIISKASLNDVYYALLLLPWVMLWRRPLWKYAGTLLVAAIVAWSMKRTAFICLVMSLGAYWLTERLRSRRLFDMGWLIGCVFSAAIVFTVFWYVDDKTEGHFQSRMRIAFEDGLGSRLEIFAYVLQLQGNSGLPHWILGHGHDTVRKNILWGEGEFISAHNDWLEVLFDYGVLSLLLYASLHVLLLRSLRDFIRSGSPLAAPMAVSYTIFFLMSLTSHLVLYASYYSYLMALWGALLALQESQPSLHSTWTLYQDKA